MVKSIGNSPTPNLLLTRMLQASSALQEVFARALNTYPSSQESPWHLLIGWGESVPGNKLALQNSGKTMNLSFSFAELGPSILYHDCVWFTPIVGQASKLALVSGGWSRMLRDFLQIQLLSPGGLETAGVPSEILGSPCLLFARVGAMLSDGDGLRIALQ